MTSAPQELNLDNLDHVSGGFSITSAIHQMLDEATAKTNQATSDASNQMTMGIVSGLISVDEALRHWRR